MKKYKNFILENKIKVDMPIPKDIEQIANAFHKAGKDLFVVGGAVRDFIQKKVPHDFDLVTNALPNETKQILKGWNVSDEQGKNFGVLRIYTDDEPKGHEIATYRKDIAKGRDVKGDDEKVEIGNHITIDDDVLRRDLTMNALFYDINKKEIVDLVGGVKDIEHNVIRSVGDPKERFSEDRLRILRVFRFAARTPGRNGGIISPNTDKAIRDDNRLRGIGPKDDVSQERILEEFFKVIEHAESGGIDILTKYIRLLTKYNMWEQMFPGVKINPNVIMSSLDPAMIFWDLLLGNDIPNIRKTLIKKLKFPNNLVDQIEFLDSFDLDIYGGGDNFDNVYKLAKKKKAKHISDDLLIAAFGSEVKPFLKYCEDGFVVDGNELSKQGFKLGEIETEKERLEIERFKNEYISNENKI